LSYLTIVQPRTSPLSKDDAKLVTLSTTDIDMRLKYLSWLFLGLAAEKRNDWALASSRYEHAMALAPTWPSAKHALAAVLIQDGKAQSASAVLKNLQFTGSDPWYGYPCQIMTLEVVSQLQEWERRQALTR
jgi:hypothetical protein